MIVDNSDMYHFFCYYSYKIFFVLIIILSAFSLVVSTIIFFDSCQFAFLAYSIFKSEL